MMTLTTGTATKRAHDERNEVDGDVFINHQATMTSIEPTHVPVHNRIRKNTSNTGLVTQWTDNDRSYLLI